MFLMDKESSSLIEITDIETLVDPSQGGVSAKMHAGEELQDEEKFSKSNLIFPSGESLPLCWVDSNYRERQ
jgi:hypothetical protein